MTLNILVFILQEQVVLVAIRLPGWALIDGSCIAVEGGVKIFRGCNLCMNPKGVDNKEIPAIS